MSQNLGTRPTRVDYGLLFRILNLDAGTLAQRMLHRCTVERVHLPTSHADLRAALAQVPLADLQVFWIHTQLHNMPAEVQGPDWSQQKEVSRSAIAAGVQRGSGLSKYALPAP